LTTKHKNIRSEKPSKPDSIAAMKLNANVNLINLLDISREERKMEAGKPLYLARYE
jgi:hypothetical protein